MSRLDELNQRMREFHEARSRQPFIPVPEGVLGPELIEVMLAVPTPPLKQEADEADRGLAIAVMDHRSKFQGSSILTLWWGKYGDRRPEDVFPDLEGFDVDAYYERLNAERQALTRRVVVDREPDPPPSASKPDSPTV